MTKKVKIAIQFEWEVTQEEWVEGKEFWAEHLESAAMFDPVDAFYHLRQIKNPSNSKVNVIKL